MGHVRRGIRMLKAAAVSCGSPRPGESLRKHCVELLQAEGMEPAIHKGAIRVLVLLAEPRVCDLC
jgi:hypothetical protein